MSSEDQPISGSSCNCRRRCVEPTSSETRTSIPIGPAPQSNISGGTKRSGTGTCLPSAENSQRQPAHSPLEWAAKACSSSESMSMAAVSYATEKSLGMDGLRRCSRSEQRHMWLDSFDCKLPSCIPESMSTTHSAEPLEHQFNLGTRRRNFVFS